MTTEPEFLSATTIIQDEVRNPEGQHLGEIEELMIDLEDGRVAYAVLSMDEKLFAIPWPMLEVDAEKACFILKVSRNLLEEAPGMDEDDWPSHRTSHKWLAEIYAHYGYDLYW
jgi:sporulation protein YlmC with PRC-barrel domain